MTDLKLILLTVACLGVGCLTSIGGGRPEIPYDANDDDAVPPDDDDALGEETCEELCSEYIKEYVTFRLAALRIAFVPAGISESEEDGCGVLFSDQVSDAGSNPTSQEVAYLRYLGDATDPLLGQAGPRAVIAGDGIGAYASPVLCDSTDVTVTTPVIYNGNGSIFLHPDWSWWSLVLVGES
jgi:hypothetical protein